ASAHARCAVADQMKRGQRAVALGTNFKLHARIRTVADREVLLFAIEHEFYRSAGLLRQSCSNYAEISGSKFCAEAATHEFCDYADLALGNFEDLGEFVADRRRSLGGGINRQQLRLPIGNYAVSLQRTVGLYLRLVVTLNDNVSFGESFFRAALLGAARSE